MQLVAGSLSDTVTLSFSLSLSLSLALGRERERERDFCKQQNNYLEPRANMTPAETETNTPGSATQVVFALLHPFLTKDSNHHHHHHVLLV